MKSYTAIIKSESSNIFQYRMRLIELMKKILSPLIL